MDNHNNSIQKCNTMFSKCYKPLITVKNRLNFLLFVRTFKEISLNLGMTVSHKTHKSQQ